MANAADKPVARSIVAAAGVRVPAGEVVRRARDVTLRTPVVVKPAGADNSAGLTLVEDPDGLDAALATAAEFGADVLVERYVPLGREVRCAVLEQRGDLVCLPLEEYAVDQDVAPIRRAADKLTRTGGGDLALAAKRADRAWIVAPGDPITAPTWRAARACYRALGCRHYGLFDFRIDPEGAPWFLEASPYCSFAPCSVVATMAAAAGLPVPELFSAVCAHAGITPA